jgi:phage gp36-like protein
MYVTPSQLADIPGALEISQVASTERNLGALVDAALMEATLRGEDRAAWSGEEIAAADEALARVLAAIDEADAVIDGYLRRRGGYTLPLDPAPPIVTRWARSIVRYLLHKSLQSNEFKDPIVRDYEDALKFLLLVAQGKFSLGAGDLVAPSGSGKPRFHAPERIFDDRALEDFIDP